MANFNSMLFFLLHLLLTLTLNQVYSYTPDYNLAINCGYSIYTITTPNNRTWLSDVDGNKKSFSFSNNENPSIMAEPHNYNPSVVDIPYGSARLSFSSFTYSFPIMTTGPLFLRLHFYPTSYEKFEPSNALFSVEISHNKKKFTLLKDFNPSLWVTNERENKIVKEYCIQIEEGDDKRLKISFIPSANRSVTTAYAFVNGVEVVSMPPFLYYTNVVNGNPSKLLDNDTPYYITNDTALEMVYRVNVGKASIAAYKDAGGMFRYWENDSPYLKNLYRDSLSTRYIPGLNYTIVRDYTAPEDVYLSARSYGHNEVDKFNVTWSFEVDSGFSYMVRLHFCEIEYWRYKKAGDRVFQIFIANIIAEKQADVIRWSGASLTPVYKDYVLLSSFALGVAKRNNLTIELQPLKTNSVYNDVILNGIEIFKISEKDNLAGFAPRNLYQNQNQNDSPPKSLAKKKNSKITKVIVAVIAISTIVLASIIIVVITLRRRKSLNSNKEETSVLPTHLCRYFTIAEIKSATKNFDEVFIIGVGGFGNVYKGYIDGYTTPVAIKRLKAGSQQGVNEFLNEIELLSQLRHVHLVSLIGYCNDGEEMILVYDFMERGTLREYLYGSENEALSWKRRIEILLGAAKGLQYLHAGAKHNIIHRDVKSTNILLDEKWVAKVSDFGLSRVGPTENTSTTHISTLVKGSFGYLDPEYYLRQRLTLKSDVYSFGVVLLEVLCARPPLLRGNVDKKKTSLVGWFQKCHNELGDIEIKKIVDPFIRDCVSDESLKGYCHVALSCLLDDGNQRPTMNDVVGCLEFVLGLVVCEEESGVIGVFGGAEKESDEGSNMRFTSSEESGSHTSKDSSIVSRSSEGPSLFSSNVFSEIGNPTAR